MNPNDLDRGRVPDASGRALDADDVRAVLVARLDANALEWFDAAAELAGHAPEAVRSLFPAAGRRCGRAPLDGGPYGWTVDDAVRALLVAVLPGAARARELADLYRYGDAAEKRGVLRALDLTEVGDAVGDAALPLVHDALRTNDTRLVAAALGPYGAARLDDHAYRQAVLKFVFTGVPLAGVAGLAERKDAELARMFADYAAERVAAGREVPPDVWLVIDHEES